MGVHSRRSEGLLDNLRVLAGGQGWLVEEAFRFSPPIEVGGPVRLRDVALYIIRRRLPESGISGRERQLLESMRDEWIADSHTEDGDDG